MPFPAVLSLFDRYRPKPIKRTTSICRLPFPFRYIGKILSVRKIFSVIAYPSPLIHIEQTYFQIRPFCPNTPHQPPESCLSVALHFVPGQNLHCIFCYDNHAAFLSPIIPDQRQQTEYICFYILSRKKNRCLAFTFFFSFYLFPLKPIGIDFLRLCLFFFFKRYLVKFRQQTAAFVIKSAIRFPDRLFPFPYRCVDIKPCIFLFLPIGQPRLFHPHRQHHIFPVKCNITAARQCPRLQHGIQSSCKRLFF